MLAISPCMYERKVQEALEMTNSGTLQHFKKIQSFKHNIQYLEARYYISLMDVAQNLYLIPYIIYIVSYQ